MASDPSAREGLRDASRFHFDDIEVDVGAHTLVRGGQPQSLEPKAFAVLVELLRHAGEMVGRDQLLDAVWGHRHVTPGVLTRAIAQLRTALDDDPHHPRYIRTQHALGYRFVGELRPEDPPTATPAVETPVDAAALAAPTLPARPLPLPGTAPPARGADRRRPDPRPRPNRVLLSTLVIVALAWLAWTRQSPPAPPPPAEPSIAVLPFATLDADPQNRWFAEGLALEMSSALAQVDGLKVASWQGGDKTDRSDIVALGRRLGVATLLDATVRREGDRMRINARLTDAASGYALWSQTYDRDISAVFETQGEIAREVAQSLLGALPDEGEGLRRRLTPTRDIGAFDAYLQGLLALVQPVQAGDAALGHFRTALARDPGFARAQAGICRFELWRFEAQRAADAYESARLACLRAANMDQTIGAVQLALGDLYRVKGPPDKALMHYGLAEADRSLRADALVGKAAVYADQGKPEQAIRSYREAIEIAPDDSATHAALGYHLYLVEDLPAAVESMRRATELDPADAHLWSTLGGLLMAADRNDEAIVALERSRAIQPIDAVLANLGTLHYQAGDYAQAATMYRQAIELNPDTNPSNWGSLADALLADPATAAQAPAMYREAANRLQAYVDVKDDDAKALAMLGWFRANLGEHAAARELAARAEALELQPGEVAIYNAQTFVALGDLEQARAQVAAARAAGAAESRLVTNVVLRRANVATPADAATPSPHAVGPTTTGERDEL